VTNDVVQHQQQPHTSQQQPQTSQQQPPQPQQQKQQKTVPTPSARSRKRLAKVLVALAGVFVGCWLPYAAALLYANWCCDDNNRRRTGVGTPAAVHRLATVVALLLGHVHSAVNPVVYWWLNRHTMRACPWCWCAGDQFGDNDDDTVADGFGCGAFGCVVGGAALAFGCGRGDRGCTDSGGLDCGGGTGCRQSQNHTPTRFNRLLFRQPNNHQRSRQPSSTNEAALGPFNPRFATPKKRPQQLPVVKNPVMLYYS
jgi:hypothetical protein